MRAEAWFESKYINGAHHKLQTDGYLLKGLFAMSTSQDGKDVTWKVAGRGDATEMSDALEDRPHLNADRTAVTEPMKRYEANEWIKVQDIHQMPESEQQVAQQTCAWAIGRRYDKVAVEAMDAAAGAITNIGNGSARLSPLDLINGQAAIKAQGIIGSPTINCIVSYAGMASLLVHKVISNADYITDNPFMKEIGARLWNGIRIIPVPDEYLATPDTNQKDGYMWLQPTVGFATPTDMTGKISLATRIDYVATKKAWFIANTMSACAKVILPEGVRRLRFLNTAPDSLAST